MKKILFMLIIFSALFLIGCSGISDEELEAEMESLSDAEVDALVEEASVEENKALAGQATRTTLKIGSRTATPARTLKVARTVQQKRLSVRAPTDTYTKLYNAWKGERQKVGGLSWSVADFDVSLQNSYIILRDITQSTTLDHAKALTIYRSTGSKKTLINDLYGSSGYNYDQATIGKLAWFLDHLDYVNGVTLGQQIDSMLKNQLIMVPSQNPGLVFEQEQDVGTALKEGPGGLPGVGGTDFGSLAAGGGTDLMGCIGANAKKGQQQGEGMPGQSGSTSDVPEGGGSDMPQGMQETNIQGSGDAACYKMKTRPIASTEDPAPAETPPPAAAPDDKKKELTPAEKAAAEKAALAKVQQETEKELQFQNQYHKPKSEGGLGGLPKECPPSACGAAGKDVKQKSGEHGVVTVKGASGDVKVSVQQANPGAAGGGYWPDSAVDDDGNLDVEKAQNQWDVEIMKDQNQVRGDYYEEKGWTGGGSSMDDPNAEYVAKGCDTSTLLFGCMGLPSEFTEGQLCTNLQQGFGSSAGEDICGPDGGAKNPPAEAFKGDPGSGVTDPSGN